MTVEKAWDRHYNKYRRLLYFLVKNKNRWEFSTTDNGVVLKVISDLEGNFWKNLKEDTVVTKASLPAIQKEIKSFYLSFISILLLKVLIIEMN